MYSIKPGLRTSLDVGTNSGALQSIDLTTSHFLTPRLVIFQDTCRPKDGVPFSQERRAKRGQRRLFSRRSLRKRLLRHLSLKVFGAVTDTGRSVLELRAKAVTEPLSPTEFGRVLLHLLKNRGPNYVCEDEDKGKAKAAIVASRREQSDRTYGQYLWDLHQKGETIRNRGGEFKHCPERVGVREEFERIWAFQQEQKTPLSRLLTKELKTKVEQLIFYQKPAVWDLNSVGHCDLEPSAHRCPKASYVGQQASVLDVVANIRVLHGRERRRLSDEERSKVLDLCKTNTRISKTAIAAALDISRFQLVLADKSIPGNWLEAKLINGVLAGTWEHLPVVTRSAILKEFSRPETTDERISSIIKLWRLSSEQETRLMELWRKRPKGRFGNSETALRNILPYLQQGLNSTEARLAFAESLPANEGRRKARYRQQQTFLNRKQRSFLEQRDRQGLPFRLPPIPKTKHPDVDRAMAAVKMLIEQDILANQAVPEQFVIETNRSPRLTPEKKTRLIQKNKQKEELRDQLRSHFAKYEKRSNQGGLISRSELWVEQLGKCPYCGKDITEREVGCNVNVEIDHIIPRAFTLDNGHSNKVLACKKCNNEKRRRIPVDWLGQKSMADVLERMRHLKSGKGRKPATFLSFSILFNDAKYDKLETPVLPDEFEWTGSQLVATSYIERALRNYLAAVFYQGDRSRIIFSKGRYTKMLRVYWDLDDKNREETFRHHVLDAAVNCFVDRSKLIALCKYAQSEDEARAQGLPGLKRGLPMPWQGFRHDVKQIVASCEIQRRVKKRVRGSLHKDTLLSKIAEGVYGHRIEVCDLHPYRLAMPPEAERIYRQLDGRNLSSSKRSKLYAELTMLEPERLAGGLMPVYPLRLRYKLSQELKGRGIDPTKFKPKDPAFTKALKELLKDRPLIVDGSPVKKVMVGAPQKNVIAIPLKNGDGLPQVHPRTGEPQYRYYNSSGNHHGELIFKDGRPELKVVTSFEAAKRVGAGLAAIDTDHGDADLVCAVHIGDLFTLQSGQRMVVSEVSDAGIGMYDEDTPKKSKNGVRIKPRMFSAKKFWEEVKL